MRSILFAATMNGVLFRLRIDKDSFVCGIKPSCTSTTTTPRSASAPPRARNVVKARWPGVSMNNKPGSVNSRSPISGSQVASIASSGTSVAPMCWVIPPASPEATVVPRIRSSTVVFPWST
jgi:hypothetical protein